ALGALGRRFESCRPDFSNRLQRKGFALQSLRPRCSGRQPTPTKRRQMNPEQLQSLAVLALVMVPVAVLWWVWIRTLD
ncbi:MAG: hypothetical protein ACKOGI_03190, partial [Vulcanococcus sp.]